MYGTDGHQHIARDVVWIQSDIETDYLPMPDAIASDTCGIRTHAGRPHRLSGPTP